jgi:hypothetical protein
MNTVQNYEWVTEIDLVVQPGGRYRTAVIVPNSWTMDQTQTYLESVGWTVISIGNPPPDVTQSIAGILQETGLPSGSSPIAFWVIATWPGATMTLPASSGQLYYATLDYYSPVSASEAATTNAEVNPPTTNVLPIVLALAGGALLIGAVLHSSKNAAARYPLHNPIKDPKMMSAAAINKELDSIDKKRSALNTKFIDAGRGYETPSETRKLSDPLAMQYNALWERRSELSIEVHLRAGPGMDRLPSYVRGFGPRKYAMENPKRRYRVEVAGPWMGTTGSWRIAVYGPLTEDEAEEAMARCQDDADDEAAAADNGESDTVFRIVEMRS